VYSVIDLFAGCGGMTLGFHQAGHFETVMAVESDTDAAETYELNFGAIVAREADGVPTPIEAVESFPEVAVVIGGPPCQGFSPLNRGVGLERRNLWEEYRRALAAASPSVFVMENVPELLRSEEYEKFKAAAESRAFGYTVEGRILNAADYGVPQRRRRAIVIGSRFGPVEWPEPTHHSPSEVPLGGEPWRTLRDAVAGLPLKPDGKDWHNARNPHKRSIERYMAIPNEGEGRFQLAARRPDITPHCWLRETSGRTDVFGRLWWDRPAVTIRTEFYKPEKGRYLHPSEHRSITVREAARCMGIPDAPAFRFYSPAAQSMTSVARQIGNAVPPPMAQHVALSVAQHLKDHLPSAAPQLAAAA